MHKRGAGIGTYLALLIGLSGAVNAADYLPLTQGSTWKLTNAPSGSTLQLTVLSSQDIAGQRKARVEMKTPWSTYILLLSSSNGSVVQEGMEVAGVTYGFPTPAQLFPIGTAGQVWNTVLGTTTLVSNTGTLSTPSGSFGGVRLYRVTYTNGDVLSWQLAEGKGFVGFGEGSASFLLTSSTIAPEPAPAVVPVVAGPCPVIGISPNPSAAANSAMRDATVAWNTALSVGTRYADIDLAWSDIETSPGVYQLSNLQQLVPLMESANVDYSITIKTLDTFSKRLPSDLASRAWDDPVLLQRFRNLLKAVNDQLGPHTKWINLANEVDSHFGNLPAEIPAFRTFFQAGITQLHSLRPSISVGIVYGLDAMRLSSAAFTNLKDLGDHIGMTYYAISGFSVRPADSPLTDIPLAVAAVGTKRILFTEIGYPSAAATGSSLTQQSDFYKNFFETLSKTSGTVDAARLFLLNELPTDWTTVFLNAIGLGQNTAAVGYFNSLGLYDSNGSAKPAWGIVTNKMSNFAVPNACYKP